MNYERVVKSVSRGRTYFSGRHSSRTYHFLLPSSSFFLHPPLSSPIFLSSSSSLSCSCSTRVSTGRREEKRREEEGELREARSPVKAFALKLRNFGRKFARQVRTIGKTLRRSISSTFPILLLLWASLVPSASSFFFNVCLSRFTFHLLSTRRTRTTTHLLVNLRNSAIYSTFEKRFLN